MIGALGACFGRVVTLDSPKARPPGDFNWEPTLWHELGHVITLQLSKQRVPRWLTEGISVYEEKLGDPDWGREGELTFAAAYGAGEIMTLRELNAAFTNPEKSRSRTTKPRFLPSSSSTTTDGPRFESCWSPTATARKARRR